MNFLDLIIKGETEGFDSLEEAVDFAVVLIETGLVNSTGSNQRFVEAIAASNPELLAERLNR